MTASPPDNEAILDAARDIPDPGRRREYVREACGGDEARVAHVEALLATGDRTDSLLDRPAACTPGAIIDRDELVSILLFPTMELTPISPPKSPRKNLGPFLPRFSHYLTGQRPSTVNRPGWRDRPGPASRRGRGLRECAPASRFRAPGGEEGCLPIRWESVPEYSWDRRLTDDAENPTNLMDEQFDP